LQKSGFNCEQARGISLTRGTQVAALDNMAADVATAGVVSAARASFRQQDAGGDGS
jgi:hypothetical protein